MIPTSMPSAARWSCGTASVKSRTILNNNFARLPRPENLAMIRLSHATDQIEPGMTCGQYRSRSGYGDVQPYFSQPLGKACLEQ